MSTKFLCVKIICYWPKFLEGNQECLGQKRPSSRLNLPYILFISPFLDPPSPPLSPQIMILSFSQVVLSWDPPLNSSCLNSYAIMLTNITAMNASYTYYTTTNTTSMTVSDLTQGATYSFSVVGIDSGERVGEESVPSEAVTFDSKAFSN